MQKLAGLLCSVAVAAVLSYQLEASRARTKQKQISIVNAGQDKCSDGMMTSEAYLMNMMKRGIHHKLRI